jgi:hypothetical protein
MTSGSRAVVGEEKKNGPRQSVFSTTKRGYNFRRNLLIFWADRTGLEPATSAVTGRHSNQLNYRSIEFVVRFPENVVQR